MTNKQILHFCSSGTKKLLVVQRCAHCYIMLVGICIKFDKASVMATLQAPILLTFMVWDVWSLAWTVWMRKCPNYRGEVPVYRGEVPSLTNP